MNNNAAQQALSERYRQIEQLRKLRENQKKFGLSDGIGLAYKGSQMLGQAGKGLSNSSDPRVAKFGNGLYKYSGQQFMDNFKKNPWDTTKGIYEGINSKLNSKYAPNSGMIDNLINNEFHPGVANETADAITKTTNTLGNTTGAVTGGASSIANTAGSATNGASALSGAANGASSASSAASTASGALGAASKAAPILGLAGAGMNAAKGNYVDAGIDAASTGAMFIPVAGPAISAALQVGKMIKNMVMGKKQEEAQKVASQAESINDSKAQETKQNSMQNIANNGQDTLKQAISDQVFSNMPQSPQNEFSFSGDINTPETQETADNEPSAFSDYLSSLSDEDFNKLYNTRRRFA